jgi:hypothetical protein
MRSYATDIADDWTSSLVVTQLRRNIWSISYKLHKLRNSKTLCNELDDTSSLLDLLLSEPGNESGLDDEWSVETSLTELSCQFYFNFFERGKTYELEFTEMSEVENWDGTFRSIGLGFR